MAVDNNVTLSNSIPSELIDKYYSFIRDTLRARNIIPSRASIIGLLAHLLAWSVYDVNNYHNYLLKEAFVATAEDQQNLLLHSYIYNYPVSLAKPATVTTGTIEFPRELFEPFDNSDYCILNLTTAHKIDIHATNSSDVCIWPTQISIENIPFSFDSQYLITAHKTQNYINASILYNKSYQYSFPFDIDTVQIPIYGLRQYTLEVFSFDIPFYNPNSIYTHELTLNYTDQHLYKIRVFVNDNNEWIEIPVAYLQLYELFVDVVSAYINKEQSKLYITFGRAGTTYYPNRKVVVVVYWTLGEDGNLSDVMTTLKDYNLVLQYYKTGQASVDHEKQISGEYVKINFTAENGYNFPDSSTLKKSIIQYIQSRDNLISELDYRNIISIKDYELVFKKSSLVANIFYVYVTLRDKYNRVIYTLSHSQSRADSPISNRKVLFYPVFDISIGNRNRKFISPFCYKYNETFNRYDLYNVRQLNTNITTNNINKLSTDDAEPFVHIVYNMYFFGDNNTDTDESSALICHAKIYPAVGIDVNDYDIKVNIPQFDNNYYTLLKCTKIPVRFIFTNGSDCVTVNDPISYVILKNILQESDKIYPIDPSDYSSVDCNTIDINDYYTITGIDFNDDSCLITLNLDRVYNGDTNTYYVAYMKSDNDRFYSYINILNNLVEDLDVTLIASRLGVDIWQYIYNDIGMVYPTKDMLYLPVYKYGGEDYVLEIPCIDYSVYLSNPEYYSTGILSVFNSLKLEQNKMITDETQIRFLNTFSVDADTLSGLTIQHYSNDLALPLKLSVNIKAYSNYISSNNIDLATEEENLLLGLAKYLNDEKTGVNITIYPSQIIDFIHNNRPWVKSVEITITDQNDNTYSEGIETKTVRRYLESISFDKLKCAMFNPIYFYWDLDNINLAIELE